MRNRLVSNVVSIAVLVALASFGGPARATTAVTSCTVSNIAFDQHVYLKCADNTTYFGFTTAEQSGCGTPTSISVDTLKIWITCLPVPSLLARRWTSTTTRPLELQGGWE